MGFQKVAEKDYPEFKTSLVFLELNGYRVKLIKDGNAKSGQVVRDVPPAHTSKFGQSQFCLLTTNLDGIKTELQNNGVSIKIYFVI
ncbi:MAG: hypothetical protein GDA42_05070 [Ekhidna sp.]|nr:hypothetical protein [Ekhidna sp.]